MTELWHVIGGFRTELWQGFFADFFQDQEDFAEFFCESRKAPLLWYCFSCFS